MLKELTKCYFEYLDLILFDSCQKFILFLGYRSAIFLQENQIDK